jgi:N-acetylglutamate synthase-like GNAT family acetyltransferase
LAEDEIDVRRAGVEEIVGLRHRVLRAGLPRESAYFKADDLETTRHFAAIHQGRVVGCATLLLNEWEGKEAWQLRGMAVDESVRGRGVGRLLIEAMEREAGASGVRTMWCNARVEAIGFYRRAGWEVASEEFVVPTAGPHVKMVRRV